MISSIPIKYKYSSYISICPIDGTLTDITTPGLSEPENNVNQGVFHTL